MSTLVGHPISLCGGGEGTHSRLGSLGKPEAAGWSLEVPGVQETWAQDLLVLPFSRVSRSYLVGGLVVVVKDSREDRPTPRHFT